MTGRDIPYVVDHMSVDDIEQVMTIETTAFSTPWSARSYQYELTQNENAHYFVVYHRESRKEPSPQGWWERLRNRVLGSRPPRLLLGYGGFWQVVDEAHISTIAVRGEYRNRGIGKLLMITMIKQAIALEADRVTLEVRVSNRAAQELYRQYGFEVTGQRRGYYSDNREDALIMTVENIRSPAFRRRLAKLERALYRELACATIQSPTFKPPTPLPRGRRRHCRTPRPGS